MNLSRVYVIDTSYLLEIFAVLGYSTKEAIDEIRSRIAAATKSGARLFVTVPSIYELANHIFDVPNGNVVGHCQNRCEIPSYRASTREHRGRLFPLNNSIPSEI